MTNAKLKEIWSKTSGCCHFCGDSVKLQKRGWRSGNMDGYWEVDHVIQRGKGGDKNAANCLPACTKCNRLRWHRTGVQVRELLLLGLIAKDHMKRGTNIGNQFKIMAKERLQRNIKRRKSLG